MRAIQISDAEWDAVVEFLKNRRKEEEKKWPQEGDRYYCIESAGNIEDYFYEGSPIDDEICRIGNIFRTEEEAEFKLEQLKVLHELEELADDDQPWDKNNSHYNIAYEYEDNNIRIESWKHYQTSPIKYYFKSHESAQAAIDKIGEDRLIKYYFGIKED